MRSSSLFPIFILTLIQIALPPSPFAFHHVAPPLRRQVLHRNLSCFCTVRANKLQVQIPCVVIIVVQQNSAQLLQYHGSHLTVLTRLLEQCLHQFLSTRTGRHEISAHFEKSAVRYLIGLNWELRVSFHFSQSCMGNFHGSILLLHSIGHCKCASVHDSIGSHYVGLETRITGLVQCFHFAKQIVRPFGLAGSLASRQGYNNSRAKCMRVSKQKQPIHFTLYACAHLCVYLPLITVQKLCASGCTWSLPVCS